MNKIKSVDSVEIQPFDVIKNTVTDVVAIVIKEDNELIAYNDVIKLKERLNGFPERQWEVVGSLLTYWCTDSLESKKLIVKEE